MIYYSKYTYQYDDSDNLTIQIRYSYNSDNATWSFYRRWDYDYDDAGHQIFYKYSTYNSGWETYYKYEYEYDDDGHQIMRSYYCLSNDVLVGSYKYEYAYDETGYQILFISYTWDSDDEEWIGNYKREYEYNEMGTRSLYSYYTWSTSESDWVMSYKYKYDYVYDDSDYTLSYKYNTYDSDKDVFTLINSTYYYYTDYTVYASTDEITIGSADLSIASLSVASEATWFLSSDESWLALSSSKGTGEESITLLASENTSTSVRTATVNLFSGLSDTLAITVTQSAVKMTDAVENTESSLINVYPNPTDGLVNINTNNEEIQSITVLSITGQKVWTSNSISNNSTIDLSDFEGNSFILQIQTDTKVYTQQIIKR